MDEDEFCAGCGADLDLEEVTFVSQLYNPTDEDDFILCEMCGEDEEDAVNEAGTNELPSLLERYRRRRAAA
jgi:hypothetical protein